MKHIFLNLKRFDIPKEYGGVNSIAPIGEWGSFIVSNTQEQLKKYAGEDVEFAMYFPEAHLIPAVGALCENSPVKVGCQGVYRDDTALLRRTGPRTRQKPSAVPRQSSVTVKSEKTRQESLRKPVSQIQRQ